MVAVDRDLNYSMPVEVEITVTHDVRDERIDELESRVRERTQELLSKNKELEQTLVQLRDAQNQLVVQEKMATLGNLVAGISHELNSPLGAVKSAGDVLTKGLERIRNAVVGSDTIDKVKADGHFQRVLGLLEDSIGTSGQAIERISHILGSLRSFARLDEAEYQLVDLHEGLESTLILLEHQLKERITGRKRVRRASQRSTVIPGELNQVFMNVIVNAVQAIEGRGTVRLQSDLDQDHVIVRIADTGRGISKERLETIFDPAFSNKDARVGMGLGLVMSYNIIRKHHGQHRSGKYPR